MILFALSFLYGLVGVGTAYRVLTHRPLYKDFRYWLMLYVWPLVWLVYLLEAVSIGGLMVSDRIIGRIES